MKRPQNRTVLVTVLSTVAGAAIAVGTIGAAPAGAFTAERNPAPASGVWTVDGGGNGHGHGMSQYGARGAAMAGLDVSKIIAFYYPGTTLSMSSSSSIRVWITDASGATTVAAVAGLSVTGVGALPTSGISQWRLVPSGAGLALQRLTSGKWVTAKALPASATFSSTSGAIRLVHGGGSSDFRGTLSAVRSGSGLITVNRLLLDDYVRGVIPNEMPASWPAAAVQAQAIAARSYARYALEHNGSGAYDICDTTNCQVYRGMSSEESASNAAVSATANEIVSYHGSVAFTQFAASNGGAMVSGGQPYLVSKADPYDHEQWTRTVSVASVAGYYGLARVTEIDITGRSGGGPWGGAVTSATVRGTDSSGAARAVPTTGPSLASVMGLSFSLFHLRGGVPAPAGHVDGISVETVSSYRIGGWTFDPARPAVSTRVHVYVDGGPRSFVANLPRPDVKRAFGISSAAHGFSVVIPIPATGRHKVCVYGMDAVSLHHSTLLCTYLSAPSTPLGHVEAVVHSGSSYQVSGWTFDPSLLGGPGRVHVYVDSSSHPFNAVRPRTDVARRYGLRNPNVGFVASVPVPAGLHRICTYGINTAGLGRNVSLGCVTVRR